MRGRRMCGGGGGSVVENDKVKEQRLLLELVVKSALELVDVRVPRRELIRQRRLSALANRMRSAGLLKRLVTHQRERADHPR
jgi:hypothetical protein